MFTLSKIRIAITVLAIAEKTYDATVELCIGIPGKKGYEKNILENIFVSGFVKWHFKNHDHLVIGQKYTCLNDSQSWMEGPLTVTRSYDKASANPIYSLLMVDQGGEDTYESTTPKGNVHKDIVFKTKNKYDFKRYIDYYEYKRKEYLNNQLKVEEAQAQVDAEAVGVDDHDDLPF